MNHSKVGNGSTRWASPNADNLRRPSDLHHAPNVKQIVDAKSAIRIPCGFTLIELLVAISIIVLLMALLLSVLQRVRAQAKAVVCQANLKQWGTTLALYAQDNKGRFPSDIGGGPGIEGAGVWLLRGTFLSKDDPNSPPDSFHRFHTKDIACCPMATKPWEHGKFIGFAGFGATMGSVQGTTGKTFAAWELTEPGPPFRGSYSFNSWLFNGFCEHPRRYPGRLGLRGLVVEVDVFSLRSRDKIPVLLDSTLPWCTPFVNVTPPPLAEPMNNPIGFAPVCINRHNGHVNGLFLDWSVRKIGLKELWTLKWYAEFDTTGCWTKAGGVKPEDWPQWMRGLKDY